MDVRYSIYQLRKLPLISKVNVNSTLARHISITQKSYLLSVTGSDTECHVNALGSTRKVLIVCYTKDREDWDIQHDEAVMLMRNGFGFEVGVFVSLLNIIIAIF